MGKHSRYHPYLLSTHYTPGQRASAVLIVEDSDVDAVIYDRFLEGVEDFVTVRVSSLADAVTHAQTYRPDLILLDMSLPDGDGVDFLRWLRAQRSHTHVPVIVITSDQTTQARHRALVNGATDFLEKPVNPVELICRIRNLLELGHSRTELAGRADWLASEVERATRDIRLREQETVYRLARAAEYRDPETGMHLVRMAMYCEVIAQAHGAARDVCEMIFLAAPMHDVGKVGTPDEILLKPSRHTPEEAFIMRQHARMGHEILKDSTAPLLQMAADIALTHHEKFDGSGYPYGMAGETIPLSGRIVALADVYDALTSRRIYKPAWSLEDALLEIRFGSGHHFDPKIVAAFEDALPEILRIRESHLDALISPVVLTA